MRINLGERESEELETVYIFVRTHTSVTLIADSAILSSRPTCQKKVLVLNIVLYHSRAHFGASATQDPLPSNNLTKKLLQPLTTKQQDYKYRRNHLLVFLRHETGGGRKGRRRRAGLGLLRFG